MSLLLLKIFEILTPICFWFWALSITCIYLTDAAEWKKRCSDSTNYFKILAKVAADTMFGALACILAFGALGLIIFGAILLEAHFPKTATVVVCVFAGACLKALHVRRTLKKS